MKTAKKYYFICEGDADPLYITLDRKKAQDMATAVDDWRWMDEETLRKMTTKEYQATIDRMISDFEAELAILEQ